MALTPAQSAALRTAVLAEPSLANAVLTGDDYAIAAWLNAPATPAWTVWKTSVSIRETGEAFNSSEVSGLTTANTSRLQVMVQYADGSFNPSRADTRAGFESVFSGAGGANTRTALNVLWKRLATRAEKLLSSGTGSDASPATLTFQGDVSVAEASLLR